jgi:uncharacterized protein
MKRNLSRRAFMKATAATGLALAVGPARWSWAVAGSPFGPLQDDPLLRLPAGFSYKILAQTGTPIIGGRGPTQRPPFPDLNVAWRAGKGKTLLSTSHEIPGEDIPVYAPAQPEEYDRLAGGAITSLLLNSNLEVIESAYNAGGMVTNCSGSGTSWGTVLTGEESTVRYEKNHGYVWEVDPHTHEKVRLDACGRFEHETAVVHKETGFVYLTEDSGGDSLLYRLRPEASQKLHRGGRLQAYRRTKRAGEWLDIRYPNSLDPSTSQQGVKKGATKFKRLEGGRFRGRYFYFTETEDLTACGKVWRLNTENNDLQLWAQGGKDAKMCMPDNVVFDRAGNMWVTEDRSEQSSGRDNRVLFIDRTTGNISPFAQVNGSIDEPTGPEFSPNGDVLFLNLQRSGTGGVTLAITGPFPERARSAARLAWDENVPPDAATSDEADFLRSLALPLTMPLETAAALVSLRRREAVDEVDPLLEEVTEAMGNPSPVPTPKRRVRKHLD